MHTLRNSLICLSGNLLAAGSLSAASITLANPSFEANTFNQYSGAPVGWETSDPNGTQFFGDVQNVSAGYTSGLLGVNALWLSGTLTQLTSATFVTGVTYTLTFDIGNPNNFGNYPSDGGLYLGFRTNANTGANAFLSDGGIFLPASAFTTPNLPDGTFTTYSVLYTAIPSDDGNPIRIGATDFFGSNSIDSFSLDNFRLSDNTAVPEPSTYSWMIGGLALLAFTSAKRRRLA